MSWLSSTFRFKMVKFSGNGSNTRIREPPTDCTRIDGESPYVSVNIYHDITRLDTISEVAIFSESPDLVDHVNVRPISTSMQPCPTTHAVAVDATVVWHAEIFVEPLRPIVAGWDKPHFTVDLVNQIYLIHNSHALEPFARMLRWDQSTKFLS